MTRTKGRQVLQQNIIVRRLSSATQNKEVHWKFFNQVYDALQEIVNTDERWERLSDKLYAWAEEARQYIEKTDKLGARLLLDQLELIKREREE